MFLVLSRPDCPWCIRAKDLLTDYNISFTEQMYVTEEERAEYKANVSNTFPTIYDDNDNKIGGYVDLEAWVMDNLL